MASSVGAVGRSQLENHDRDDDCEDAVAEGFEPALGHPFNRLASVASAKTKTANARAKSKVDKASEEFADRGNWRAAGQYRHCRRQVHCRVSDRQLGDARRGHPLTRGYLE